MSVDVSGIKSEAMKPLPLFCHACFSVDRTLWPAGDLLHVFYSLFENRSTPPRVCLCWECLALLRRVSDFKKNVSTVQNFLYDYQLNQGIPLPRSLTRLATATTSHEVASRDDGRPESEVKHEPPAPAAPLLLGFNFKQEIDDDRHYSAHSWQNDELDVKDYVQTSLALSNWRKDRKQPSRKVRGQPSPQKVQKQPSPQKTPKASKYVRIAETELSLQKMYRKVPLDHRELSSLLAQDRADALFLQYPHRCDKCVRGWTGEEPLLQHNKKHHSKSAGPLECDICGRRAAHKSVLARHLRAHHYGRACAECPYRCAGAGSMRRHALKCHVRTVKCLACAALFYNVREFYEHHKSLHRQFVCDHCGKRYVSRASIKKHLANHGPFVCRLCAGQVFKTRDSLGAHNRLKHATLPRPELAYCVECDKQFDSVRAYRMHLADNDAHRKNARKRHFPCPDCGKVYVRNAYMRAHHNLVHLKRSDFACRDCDASFVNRAQYVLHVKLKHEGYTRPKNKLCPVCGRGFSRNWYLRNHLRTHTGERPFPCAHCDATFSQRAAMKAHVRHIHLKAKS